MLQSHTSPKPFKLLVGFSLHQGVFFLLFLLAFGLVKASQNANPSISALALSIGLLAGLALFLLLTRVPRCVQRAGVVLLYLSGLSFAFLSFDILSDVSLCWELVVTCAVGFFSLQWCQKLAWFGAPAFNAALMISSGFGALIALVGVVVASFSWAGFAVLCAVLVVAQHPLMGGEASDATTEPTERLIRAFLSNERVVRYVIGFVLIGLAVGILFPSVSGTLTSENGAFLILFFSACMCIAGCRLGIRFPIKTQSDGSLQWLYKISFFLAIVGLLLVPFTSSINLSGYSIALASCFGILVVLLISCVTLANSESVSCVFVLGRALTALAFGLLLGSIVGCLGGNSPTFALLAPTAAAIILLFVAVFLITSNDWPLLTPHEKNDPAISVVEYMASTYDLSEREAEVLPLALKGRTSERIASEFFISKNTVDTHLRRIYAKCGVSNRQALIDLSESLAEKLV